MRESTTNPMPPLDQGRSVSQSVDYSINQSIERKLASENTKHASYPFLFLFLFLFSQAETLFTSPHLITLNVIYLKIYIYIEPLIPPSIIDRILSDGHCNSI